MTSQIFKMSLLATLLIGACSSAEQYKVDAVRVRADSLIHLWQTERWHEAANFLLVDDAARRRMSLPEEAEADSAYQVMSDWFERLYGNVKPGPVVSIRIDERDPGLAVVSYHHDDIDGFYMRNINGTWHYTLDVRPRVTLQHGATEVNR